MDNLNVSQNTECYMGFRMVDRFKARKAYKPKYMYKADNNKND